MAEPGPPPSPLAHGAAVLPCAVRVDAYNAELRTPEGFFGDRASSRAFDALLDHWRRRLRAVDAAADPLGDTPTEAIGRRGLDRLLAEGDAEAAGLVHGVVEEFAQALAEIARCLLRLEAWRGTERIVVGGGLRGSRVGELAIGRAGMLLKAEDGRAIELVPIRHDPDEAGLLGGLHLAPRPILAGHDGALAVDIGGSNIRAGVVRTNLGTAPDLSRAEVWRSEIWRHRNEDPERDDAVARLADMLRDLARQAEGRSLRLASFVGVGCPGRIAPDGSIAQGAQNLPGDWESPGFNLPRRLAEALPELGGQPTVMVVHNDAVAQGLSEAPFQRGVARWGVLTIGTGLGNARFTNAAPPR
jgi:hypothetical protein